ncbi:MAG: DUF1573 domain-containing protein [Bacteroidia bacterium]
MKKLFYSLFIIAAAGSTANAQQSDAAKSGPTAEIAFEKETHDFGTMPYEADGAYEFKFTNTGKQPLIITNARGSCGCTVPTYSKEPIAPGASGTIKVSYDTKRVGGFTKTVTIESNAATPTRILTIKGSVDSKEASDQNTPVKKIEMGATPVEKAK